MPGSNEHPALQSWRRAERRQSAMKQRCIGRGLAWKGKCFTKPQVMVIYYELSFSHEVTSDSLQPHEL